MTPTYLRGSLIGTVVGAIPCPGANIAGWFAYVQERRWSAAPERFGKGGPSGVAAPESANSASVVGALMPLMTLGLPGSPTTAVLLGAFVIDGLQPGPQLFESNPDVVYGIFCALMLAYILVWVLGTVALAIWQRVLQLSNGTLAAGIMTLSIVGAYSVRNLGFDVWLALAFGIVGCLLKKLNFPMAPLVLAVVLGALVESNYARALIISNGDHSEFLTEPLSALFLLIAATSLILPVIRAIRQRRKSLPRDKNRTRISDTSPLALLSRRAPVLGRIGQVRAGCALAVTIALAASFVAEHYGAPGMLFALLIGIVFNFLGDDPKIRPGVDFCSNTVLRLGVALLGRGCVETAACDGRFELQSAHRVGGCRSGFRDSSPVCQLGIVASKLRTPVSEIIRLML